MNRTIKEFKLELEQIETSKANGGKVEEVKPECWTDDNWVAELKLDGTRLKMHITSEGNRFDTRRISEKSGVFMERTNNFPHLRDLDLPEFEGTVLDGEGIANVKTDTMGATQSIVGSSPEKAWDRQDELGLIQYWVFDIIKFKGDNLTTTPYEFRHRILEQVVKIITDKYPECGIKIVQQHEKDKKEFYQQVIGDGGEGIMLKDLRSTYGDRKGLIKCKKFERLSMIICGFKAGAGKYTGGVGSIQVKFYGEEPLTYASGLSDEQRWDMTKNPDKYLGRVVELEIQEKTKTGSLRHPRMIDLRDEILPEQCTRNQNERP